MVPTSTYRRDRAGDGKQPKYRQVKMHLMDLIRCGTYGPGDALPKERDLAASLAVASNTLRHALQELEADGLIRRVRGQGTFATSPEHRRSLVRSNLFMLIVHQVHEALYPSLICGFEQGVAGTPYRITVNTSGNEVTRQEALIRQAIDDNVAGVAIVPTTFPLTPPEHLRLLQEHHIPFVFCHRPVDGVSAPLVTWSGKTVGQMVAQTLLEHGHRRIATIVAFRDPMVNATVGGIEQTLGAFGLPPSAYSVRYHGERLLGAHAREAIRRALAAELNAADRPTAIYCANLLDAEQVFLLAGEMGLSIPDDLSLIYFGDSQPSGGLAQRLTCVAVDARSIGRQAAKLLQEMLAGRIPQDSDQRIEIPLTFLPGETVSAPPT